LGATAGGSIVLHQGITERASKLVQSARINSDPFPHIVVDGIFPEPYYEQILRNLPPQSSLSIPAKFGMMKIEDSDPVFSELPSEGRQFWSTFDVIVKPAICRALLQRYLPYAGEKLSLIFGDSAEGLARSLDPDEFRPLRGIVQCRIAGARMGAHVDKATSLFTYLFYFAPDNSLRPFGTVFYEAIDRATLLQRYRANRNVRAWFPAADELKLTPCPPLEFRRNRLVSYLNLPYSLHGAATDAEAPRYSMQSFCDLPLRVTLPLYEGWRDPISPTGTYQGDD
jgi:hypothetical protein